MYQTSSKTATLCDIETLW